MPVNNPKQNQHRWWGTLTADPDTQYDGEFRFSKTAGDGYPLCIFIKTTRDSHFVSSGTYIGRLKVFKDLAEAMIRIDSLPLCEEDREAIKSDLKNIESPYCCCPLVEVLEFDYARSSPLAIELNIRTKTLFEDSDWLRKYGSQIGKDEIERGLRLKL